YGSLRRRRASTAGARREWREALSGNRTRPPGRDTAVQNIGRGRRRKQRWRHGAADARLPDSAGPAMAGVASPREKTRPPPAGCRERSVDPGTEPGGSGGRPRAAPVGGVALRGDRQLDEPAVVVVGVRRVPAR